MGWRSVCSTCKHLPKCDWGRRKVQVLLVVKRQALAWLFSSYHTIWQPPKNFWKCLAQDHKWFHQIIFTKASSGRAKLEFLFTKIGVGSKLIWPRDRIDISKERALHPPPPPPPPPQKKVIESIMTPPPPWDWFQLNRNWFEAPPPPPFGIDTGGHVGNGFGVPRRDDRLR